MTKKEFMERLEDIVVRKYNDIVPSDTAGCPIARLGQELGNHFLTVGFDTITDGTVKEVFQLRVSTRFLGGIIKGFDDRFYNPEYNTKEGYLFGKHLRQIYDEKWRKGE